MGRSERIRLAEQQRKRKLLKIAAGLGAIVLVAIVVGTALQDNSGKSASSNGSTASDDPTVGGDLHSLVADPTHPNRLFVGGHAGVGVSDDGGHSWTQVPSLNNADAMGWAFTDTGIWQGGHPGLHHSSASDLTFAVANSGLPATDIHALGGSGSTLYGASPAAGVFASINAGKGWETRGASLGRSFMGRILVDPSNAQHLVAPDMSAGAVESSDGGVSWRSLGGPTAAMWVSWIAGDPGRILVSTESGASRSDDAGKTWRAVSAPDGVTLVEASPNDPQIMWGAALTGTRATVWRSIDGGNTWNKP